MNINVNDRVIDMASYAEAVVIATHTYNEGIQVASIRIEGKGSKWVPVSELKKVSS